MGDGSWRLCPSCNSYNHPQALDCVSCSAVFKVHPRELQQSPRAPLLEEKAPSRLVDHTTRSSRKTCGNCGTSNPGSSHNCLVCKHVLKSIEIGGGRQSQGKFAPSKASFPRSAPVMFQGHDSGVSSRDGFIDRGRQFGEELAARSGNPWSDLSAQNKTVVEGRIRSRLQAENRGLTDRLKRQAVRRAWRITLWISLAILVTTGWFVATVGLDTRSYSGPFTIWMLLSFSSYLLLRAFMVDRYLRKPLSDLEAGVNAGSARYAQALDESKYARPLQGAKGVPIAEVKTLTPREAENFCAAWLVRLGFLDAEVTRFSRDGGIDVHAKNVVAQVKHQQSKVGVKPIRELHGVAALSSKKAVFFTLTGYSSDALDFAEKISMPLFVYGNSDLRPCNVHAELFAAGRLGA